MLQIQSGKSISRLADNKDLDVPPLYSYNQECLNHDLSGLPHNDTDNIKQFKTAAKVDLLEEGDLVFSFISGKAAIVQKDHAGYYYSHGFAKITTSEILDKSYLCFLLNEHPIIKEQMKKSNTGAVVKSINKDDLLRLELPPLPPLEMQQMIGRLYQLEEKIQALKSRKLEIQKTVFYYQLGKEVTNIGIH